jgi:hypothetical protein
MHGNQTQVNAYAFLQVLHGLGTMVLAQQIMLEKFRSWCQLPNPVSLRFHDLRAVACSP